MRIIDPGHQYALNRLDGDGEEILTFVKREGEGYPGNVGHHTGTNMQEVFRALIDRLKYVDNQISDEMNSLSIEALRAALYCLEIRAAERHGRSSAVIEDRLDTIELMPTCNKCGHIGCNGNCH